MQIFKNRSMRLLRRASRVVFSLLVVATMIFPLIGKPNVAHADIVSETHHVRLGFSTAIPFSESKSDSAVAGAVSYHFAFDGTANLHADMGVDVTLSYDRAAVVPGGTVPVHVTYTPTNDAGAEFSIDVTGDVTADVDVDLGAEIAICLFAPPACPFLIALDNIEGDLNDFTLAAGSGNFAAPMGANPPAVIALGGDTVALQFFTGDNLVEATVQGSISLSPAGPGVVEGLGGGAAVASVSGATIDGGLLSTIDILEWQSSGESLTVNLKLPVTPGPSVGLDLSPVLHWLGTSADIRVDINLVGALGDLFGDPSDVTVFSGSLGQVFQDAGIDTQIGDAVADAIGFDPGVAPRVAAGFLPVPFTNPAIATIPPFPGLGSVEFTIDMDSDGDGLLDGEEIAIGTDPDDADSDNDGLSDFIEVRGANPTNPLDDDSDNDGLLDGEEDANHNGAVNAGETNPNDADSDDDLLIDGCEVEGSNPTNPLDADSDNDDLTDGFEDTNKNCAVDPGETNPNDADSDDDELNDGLEVAYGTNPLNPDTDGDGIPDGEDTEWLQNAISGLAASVFKAGGNRTSMLSQLDNVENLVATNKVDQAIKELQKLRERVDGCGATADVNDWIIDCTAQTQIRGFIDLLITNLSS